MWSRVSPCVICTLSITEDHNARPIVAKQERKRSAVPRFKGEDFQACSNVASLVWVGLVVLAMVAPVLLEARTTII